MAWRSAPVLGSSSGRSIHGRVCGIPLRIDASWFVIVALLSWSLAVDYFPSLYSGLPRALHWLMGALAAVLLFVCVLLHELAHSLVAKRFGIPVLCVTLFIFGGVAQIAGDPKRPSVELKVALAGPLASALLAGSCLAASALVPQQAPVGLIAAAILHYLTLINAALILFNLLPGFPLDGGRILRAILWKRTGSFARATRIASRIGSALGWGLIGLGIWALTKGAWIGGAWYALLGIFLRNAARSTLLKEAA